MNVCAPMRLQKARRQVDVALTQLGWRKVYQLKIHSAFRLVGVNLCRTTGRMMLASYTLRLKWISLKPSGNSFQTYPNTVPVISINLYEFECYDRTVSQWEMIASATARVCTRRRKISSLSQRLS